MVPKFRAWWIQDEVMTHIDTLEFLQGGIRVSDGCWHEKFLGDEVILMQSTGLKDKNGVEIYERDIVKNNKGEIGRVVYLKQEAGFVVVLPKSDYRLGHRNTGEPYDVASGHEVIGNIYQNPELLEER
ncbi:YopX family protein [Enterococcus dongliensis]|uniref:YopX family protein n=1 Tax=Enterococcus dongliensis TaxID=2559925 RepID=UPI00288E85A7|nr:YopX family protein [Enterococcus dongliensis]MDT2640655.1 YopX family protein [Enterococcus dongliensis]